MHKIREYLFLVVYMCVRTIAVYKQGYFLASVFFRILGADPSSNA